MKLIIEHNLNNHNYYQDTEYVSNSMLNNLTGKSPEYFRFAMDNPQLSTPAMKFGSALHMNVLQPEEFNNNYAVSPKFDKRTKQGKIDYAEFVKANIFKTVVSEQDYELIEQMTDKLMRDLDIIVDLKTTQDSSYYGFASSVKRYKYYKQAAFYMDAVGAQEFYIVAIEKSPPFNINIIQLGDDLLDKGRELYSRDLEVYKYCLDNDYWPGQGFDYLDKKSERTIHIMNEDIL